MSRSDVAPLLSMAVSPSLLLVIGLRRPTLQWSRIRRRSMFIDTGDHSLFRRLRIRMKRERRPSLFAGRGSPFAAPSRSSPAVSIKKDFPGVPSVYASDLIHRLSLQSRKSLPHRRLDFAVFEPCEISWRIRICHCKVEQGITVLIRHYKP